MLSFARMENSYATARFPESRRHPMSQAARLIMPCKLPAMTCRSQRRVFKPDQIGHAARERDQIDLAIVIHVAREKPDNRPSTSAMMCVSKFGGAAIGEDQRGQTPKHGLR